MSRIFLVIFIYFYYTVFCLEFLNPLFYILHNFLISGTIFFPDDSNKFIWFIIVCFDSN